MLGAAEEDVVARVAEDVLAVHVVDRDVDVEVAERALVVGDTDLDDMMVRLLIVEQQPVGDGDMAGAVHGEAPARIVQQGVGEGGAIRILADDGAGCRAIG